MRQPKIEILHTRTCQGYRQAENALREALGDLGLKPEYNMIEVRSTKEAERLRFFGSPTLRIDGEDVDRKAAAVTHFGMHACRPYILDGKAYDYPPKQLILDALRRKGYAKMER